MGKKSRAKKTKKKTALPQHKKKTDKTAYLQRIRKWIKNHKLAVALSGAIGAAGLMGVHKEIPHWLGKPRHQADCMFVYHVGLNHKHIGRKLEQAKKEGKKYDVAFFEINFHPTKGAKENQGEKQYKNLKGFFEQGVKQLKIMASHLSEPERKELAFEAMVQGLNAMFFKKIKLPRIKKVFKKLKVSKKAEKNLMEMIARFALKPINESKTGNLQSYFFMQSMLLCIKEGIPVKVAERYKDNTAEKLIKLRRQEKDLNRKMNQENTSFEELIKLGKELDAITAKTDKIRNRNASETIESESKKLRAELGKRELNSLVIYGARHSPISEMLSRNFSVESKTFENIDKSMMTPKNHHNFTSGQTAVFKLILHDLGQILKAQGREQATRLSSKIHLLTDLEIQELETVAQGMDRQKASATVMSFLRKKK